MSRFVCFIDDEGQVGTCLKEMTENEIDCSKCEFNDDDHKKFVEEYCGGIKS